MMATSIAYEGLPPVAPEFDAAALRANILDSQRHGQPYREFTRRAMAGGGGGFGFGKFRRDDQPTLRYGSAGQGCLVQKFVAVPHRLALWSMAGYTRNYSTGRADGTFAQVKRSDHFI